MAQKIASKITAAYFLWAVDLFSFAVMVRGTIIFETLAIAMPELP
jgi:hypothetical protein